jgi:hypothetical protein
MRIFSILRCRIYADADADADADMLVAYDGMKGKKASTD